MAKNNKEKANDKSAAKPQKAYKLAKKTVAKVEASKTKYQRIRKCKKSFDYRERKRRGVSVTGDVTARLVET